MDQMESENYDSEEEFPYTCKLILHTTLQVTTSVLLFIIFNDFYVAVMDLNKHNIGGPTAVCPHCNAIMWNEKDATKNRRINYQNLEFVV